MAAADPAVDQGAYYGPAGFAGLAGPMKRVRLPRSAPGCRPSGAPLDRRRAAHRREARALGRRGAPLTQGDHADHENPDEPGERRDPPTTPSPHQIEVPVAGGSLPTRATCRARTGHGCVSAASPRRSPNETTRSPTAARRGADPPATWRRAALSLPVQGVSCAENCGPVTVTALDGLRHPRDVCLRVLPGRRVPLSSRSSSTGGRPTRSIFLRTWPSSLAMKTPPTPVKPVWS